MIRALKFVAAGVAICVLLTQVQAQRRGPGRGVPDLENDPFVGVTTDGNVEKGLFKIEATGVSTEPVRKAAVAFLDGISDEQVSRTMYPIDDLEWRKWDNRHFYKRQGVGFDEMDEAQRELAFNLMKASLSAKGLKLSQDIMKLNGTLAELAENYDEYGEWLYWITIMGNPANKDKPWGWQIDGHHLIINYFVLKDQVVMSPLFVGSEPIEAKAGKFKGTIVLQDEQARGLKLIQALNEQQQTKAILNRNKTGNDSLAQAYKDNLVLDYAGIPGKDLNDNQRKLLLDVVEGFVGNMDDGHAKVKMSEVEQHLDRTYFAWVGGTTDKSVYYYRVHSPVVLIEFDHQRRVAPFRSREPTRDHIHAVLRTPNGNDYGKDILRQHYEHAHGGTNHSH